MNPPEPLKITAEDTPNPLSNKFIVNRTLLSGPGRDFSNRQIAELSPLATDIFYIPGVSGVYIGANFVTVTVLPNNSWWTLRPMIEQTLDSFFLRGEPAIAGNAGDAGLAQSGSEQRMFSPEELGIMKILEDEIRPAVAMDGGDVTLVSYENKIVKLRLRGACHSCPSSTVTLKMGIEGRLKQAYPEILAVEQV